MNDDLRDNLIYVITPYITSKDDMENIKMKIDILLSKYSIAEKSTEVVPYSGDVNEKILKKFLYSKMAKGCSLRTIDYYRDTIQHFFLLINKLYMDVTADDVRLYMAIRVQRDRISKRTANNERRNLSSFYGWLQKEEILLKNPMAKVDPVKETRENKKAFSAMEMETIRAACQTSRERAIVEMLFSTWCRISELVSIKIADIHDGKCTVHGKGDKMRDVYLNARALIAVQAYLNERKDKNPYLFAGAADGFIKKGVKGRASEWYKTPSYVSDTNPLNMSSAESIVRKIGATAGIKNVHPHRFRRTGATMALRSGMPLIQVSKLLGHESIDTTQIYLDISDTELEEAHEKYVI